MALYRETFFHLPWSKNFLFYGVILTLTFEGVREKNGEKEDSNIDKCGGVRKTFPPWRK